MPEKQDRKYLGTKCGEPFEPVTISEYFRYVSALIDSGCFYKDPETRYVLPVKQLASKASGELTTAEDMYVEVQLSKEFLYQKSETEISSLLDIIKNKLDNNTLPSGQTLIKITENDIRRTHEPDPNGRPYRYVSRVSEQDDNRHLKCLSVDHNILWPTPVNPQEIEAGGAIAINRKELRRLETRVAAIRSFLDNNTVQDQDYVIRRELFSITGGPLLSTRDNIKPVQPEEFYLYEPV